jgi:hypothetical protein
MPPMLLARPLVPYTTTAPPPECASPQTGPELTGPPCSRVAALLGPCRATLRWRSSARLPRPAFNLPAIAEVLMCGGSGLDGANKDPPRIRYRPRCPPRTDCRAAQGTGGQTFRKLRSVSIDRLVPKNLVTRLKAPSSCGSFLPG